MIKRVASRLAATALLAVALGASSARANEPDKFVVHEWGTFSTFSGSDGKSLKFHPNDGDLPNFVYNRHREVKGGIPDAMVSLETPVLYFYSDRDRSVSVNIDFPKGVMTDWYPQASRPPTHNLRWDDIKVLAKGSRRLIGEGQKGRYYAARETDASSVEVGDKHKAESEKFLFYRGVGDFTMPVSVRASGKGTFTVKNTGKDAVPAYILLRVHDHKVYFQVHSRLSPNSEERVEESRVASTIEKLGDQMAKLLVEQGLYEKEARAMVKTWGGDWFNEEGTRVLYLLAEPTTADFLPLKIEPIPDKTVRVLVGRHDVLTPERERQIDALVKRVNGDSNTDSTAADRELAKLGRYRWTAQAASEARIKEGARAGR